MARPKRRAPARAPNTVITDRHLSTLLIGRDYFRMFPDEAAMHAAWRIHGEGLTELWVHGGGRRAHEASGTPIHEWRAKVYGGAGTRPRLWWLLSCPVPGVEHLGAGDKLVQAADRDEPEPEVEFLDRHGLLTDFERAKLGR